MSEYQHIEFRAIDRPLTDEQLSFARKQSTRAEITRWSFQNEYHFGDFSGDVHGLLHSGYDLHLHYGNFGVRTAAFRLPAGLPLPKAVWSRYVGVGQLAWRPDPSGKAGILLLEPYHEAGELDEVWEFDRCLDAMAELRTRLLTGDLRALYALWLCSVFDDQEDLLGTPEPPVPAGLAECVEPFGPMLEFFGLDPLVLAAAAEGTGEAPSLLSPAQQSQQWVDQLSEKEAKRLLNSFLTDDPMAVRADVLAQQRAAGDSPEWPTFSLGRSCQKLLDRSSQLRDQLNELDRKKRQAAAKRKAAKREQERQERMKQMLDQPREWLRKVDKLVDERGTDNYEQAAELLSDLRQAIGGEEGERLTRKHAAHLAKKHPTLARLKSSLRKRNLYG